MDVFSTSLNQHSERSASSPPNQNRPSARLACQDSHRWWHLIQGQIFSMLQAMEPVALPRLILLTVRSSVLSRPLEQCMDWQWRSSALDLPVAMAINSGSLPVACSASMTIQANNLPAFPFPVVHSM